MEFFESSKYYTLNKPTYTYLRWIGILGQIITIYIVKFYFGFSFQFLLSNFVIGIGIISNLYLIFFYEKNQITDKSSFIFLIIDIFQLSSLFYLTGGIINPFSIFIIVPPIFSSIYLSRSTNLSLVLITIFTIVFLTFYHQPLPSPLNEHFHIDDYYYYAVPTSLIIALIFLTYFAVSFGRESRLRKEALNKMEEIMAKEHELLSLGGQAAAAAHSLNTPLSTIKLISNELIKEVKNQDEVRKDVLLLVSQVKRCEEILKKLSIDPSIEDDFIEKDISLSEYINEILISFREISDKKFIFDVKNDLNPFKIIKSNEMVYGLRNFIGNANKFSEKKVYISLTSNNLNSIIKIEDDGPGYPKEIINRLGEPYVKSKSFSKNRAGLGLGIFIGKTLLEKNYAQINFKNSEIYGGAEVNIVWKNKKLKEI